MNMDIGYVHTMCRTYSELLCTLTFSLRLQFKLSTLMLLSYCETRGLRLFLRVNLLLLNNTYMSIFLNIYCSYVTQFRFFFLPQQLCYSIALIHILPNYQPTCQKVINCILLGTYIYVYLGVSKQLSLQLTAESEAPPSLQTP